MSAPEFYLRSYPMPDDIPAQAAAAEQDGWDGLLSTDTQNLSMDVMGAPFTWQRRLRRGSSSGPP